jgi:hypothetical protein
MDGVHHVGRSGVDGEPRRDVRRGHGAEPGAFGTDDQDRLGAELVHELGRRREGDDGATGEDHPTPGEQWPQQRLVVRALHPPTVPTAGVAMGPKLATGGG